ncbi:MAG TPA: WG repeat-containing protein [Bacteroidia bacterium]|nr:WG repeat-containing protein [Bacteroidia bacterium]
MKKPETKIIFLSILLSVFFIPAFSQLGENRTIPWGEQNDDSYVEIKDGKFGLVMQGKVTIPTKYQIEQLNEMINFDGNAYFPDSAQFALGLDGKWGIMNNRGIIIVPFEYDYIHIERSYPTDRLEYAGVEKNGKCAIMDSKGKLITGYDYDAFYGYYKNDAMLTDNPKLAMKLGDRVVFYDPVTKKNLPTSPLQEFGVESKLVYYKMKMGAVSQNGDIILPVVYDDVRGTGENFENRNQPLCVGNAGKYGIWQFGKGFILPMQYEAAGIGYVGGSPLFVVSQNKKWALLDATGKNLTGYEYDNLYISFGEISGMKGKDSYVITRDGKATLSK